MRLESRRRKDLEERKYERGKGETIEGCEGEGRVRKTYNNICGMGRVRTTYSNIWGKTEGC